MNLKYPEDFINHVINGDSLEILKLIPSNSIDLIITSPPYNVGTAYDIWNDDLFEDEYWEFTRKWIKKSSRILKVGGRIAINIPVMGNNSLMKKSNKYLFHLSEYLELIKSELSLRECITWIKSFAEYDENIFCGGNTAWGSWLSPSNPYLRSFSEFIIIAHKNNPKIQHSGNTDLTKDEFLRFTKNVWFFPPESDRTHPAPFPRELPYRCIKLYSYINDIILDPFCGWGTTCLVAKQLHRNYIGIDISNKYCKMARSRLSQTTLDEIK